MAATTAVAVWSVTSSAVVAACPASSAPHARHPAAAAASPGSSGGWEVGVLEEAGTVGEGVEDGKRC